MKRESRYKFLKSEESFAFKAIDSEDKTVLSEDGDFFVYMKNVNLKKDHIEGRYLGDLTDNSSILDDNCVDLKFDPEHGYLYNNQPIKTARMVAIKNKEKVIVIIK